MMQTFDGRPGAEGWMITGTKQGCLYWWPQPVAAASSHNGMLHYLIRVGLSGFSRLFFKQMNPRGSVRRADKIIVLWMPIYWSGEVHIYNPHNRISFAFKFSQGQRLKGCCCVFVRPRTEPCCAVFTTLVAIKPSVTVVSSAATRSQPCFLTLYVHGFSHFRPFNPHIQRRAA